MLELLAAYIGRMYGDQAGLPVHGDGPVVAALSDGLTIIDRDGVVQLWNPAAEQLTGRSAAEVLGRELQFPVPPPGQVLVHRLPSGRLLKVTAGDLPNTPAMRVVTFRDSTDQDRRQEDRDLWVAVTSHELRTPVTVIKGYADTLTNHWDSLGEAGRQEAVRVIGARAGELARLVDRLLSATSEDGEVGGSPARAVRPGRGAAARGRRAARPTCAAGWCWTGCRPSCRRRTATGTRSPPSSPSWPPTRTSIRPRTPRSSCAPRPTRRP